MKNKITFTLYQIDKGLPEDMIEGYLDLETTDDLDPKIYRLAWQSVEDPDLDKLYAKYSMDGRPNNFVCRSISVSDVVEIEDEHGMSTFYVCDNFGWIELPEFDKGLVPGKGFEECIINMDREGIIALYMDIKSKAVIQIMGQRLGKSNRTVTTMFRKSKTFEGLYDQKTEIWSESPYLIADAFEVELRENP